MTKTTTLGRFRLLQFSAVLLLLAGFLMNMPKASAQYLMQHVQAPNAFVDISQAPNKLVFPADSTMTELTLDFGGTFPFACETLSGDVSCKVSTYGGLLLAPGTESVPATNQALFYTGFGHAILPLWDAWIIDTTDAASGVYFEQRADTLILQWNRMRVAPFVQDANSVTFQVQLFLSSGKILMVYPDLDAAGGVHDHAASATIGLQEATGAKYTFSLNAPAMQSGEGLWFIPVDLEEIETSGPGACQPDGTYRQPLNISFNTDTSGQGTLVIDEIWPILYINDQAFALSHSGTVPDYIDVIGDGSAHDLYLHYVNHSVTCDRSLDDLFTADNCPDDCDLVCTDTVNVSLDGNCTAEVYVSTVLELNSSCPGQQLFLALVSEEGIPYAGENFLLIDRELVGQIRPVTIFDLASGNSCISVLRIEDKIVPLITAEAYELSCADLVGNDLSREVSDACSGAVQTVATPLAPLTITDCESPYASILPVMQIAVDAYGNRDTVIDSIFVLRFDPELVVGPENFTQAGGNALSCNPADQPWDLNGDGYPDLNEFPGPTYEGQPLMVGMPFCNVVVDFNEQVFPMACKTKYMRTWQIIDDDCGQDTNIVQVIEVLKDLGPQLTCPADLTVTTNASNCQASVFLPYPAVTAGCSNVVRVQADYGSGVIHSLPLAGQTVSLPVGNHTIVYTVFDNCGNSASNTCDFEVQVRDNTNPVASCVKNVVVALNNLGQGSAAASSFNLGSHDECGNLLFDARRMLPNSACGITADWNDTVYFCCSDIPNNPIQVQFRVTDAGGNTNVCMVNVTIQDKIAPSITCPPNVTVHCGFIFDTTDLAQHFGQVETDPNEVDAIILPQFLMYDVNGNPQYSYQSVGEDGLAQDNNCSQLLQLRDTAFFNIGNCGTGTILRQFSTMDPNGSVGCSQTITITDFDPFNEDDIIWPKDTILYSACMGVAIDPEDLPAGYDLPQLLGDACDLTGIGHEDFVFNNTSNGACGKIIRRWRVLDWCQYGSDTTEGLWQHDQVLLFYDTIAPQISSLPDTFNCSYDGTCFVQDLTLSASGSDNCTPAAELVWTYQVDLAADGVLDLFGNGKSYTGSFPLGNHRIRFEARDRCGNSSEVWQNIEIGNCKAPSVTLLFGLAAELTPMDQDNDGTPDVAVVTLYANDFDAGSQASCGGALNFSFDPDGLITSLVFDCDDLEPGTDSTYIPLPIYVTDIYGNQDFANTYLYLQDNTGFCSTATKTMVAGQIADAQAAMVEAVQLQIKGSNLAATESGSNGGYQFMSLATGKAYEVIPSKSDDPMNGVSTQDLVLIQKHILKVELFQKPEQFIAADVNRDRKVTAADLVNIRKVILQKQPNFPDNYSWRFIRSDYAFNNPGNPLAEVFPETYEIPNLTHAMMHADFKGVKLGDLSGNAKASGYQAIEERSGYEHSIQWTIQDRQVEKPGLEKITVRLAEAARLEGFQLTLEVDPTIWKSLQLEEANLLGLEAEHINADHLEEGYILLSWNTAQSLDLPAGTVLFSLLGERRAGGWLSDGFRLSNRQIASEAYLEAAEAAEIDLRFGRGTESLDPKAHYSLNQNVPNPFNKSTVIGFYLPAEQKAVLRITDLSGKLLLERSEYFGAGYHEWQVDRKALPASGIYLYQLEAGTFQATRKLVLTE